MNTIMRNACMAVAVMAIILLGTWGILSFKSFEYSAAQTSDTTAELRGHLWAGVQNHDNNTPGDTSDDTRQGMGWISLNCVDGGPNRENICATSDYKVEIDLATKELRGYAWGSNTPTDPTNPADVTGLGWLRFGGLSGCPSEDLDGDCDARVTGNATDGWELTGWARACSVFTSGCSGPTKDTDSDPTNDHELGGWDGWVSLNCDNHAGSACTTYRVLFNDSGTVANVTSDATAWGSDVLGAVSFTAARIDGPECAVVQPFCSTPTESTATDHNLWCEPTETVTTCTNGCNTTTGLCNGTALTGDFTVTPAIVRRGETVEISWNYPGAGSCDVSGAGTDGITNTSNIATGETTAPVTLNQTTITLTCDGVVVATQVIRLLPDTYES